MTKRFASGSKAWGLCQRCGQRFKLHALQSDGRQRNLLVCTSCWDPKEPLDVPPRINDPTALRRPSPENSVGQVAVISWPSLDLDANTTFFGSAVWVAPVATTLTKVSGDNQTGDEGVPLTAMVVRVNDQYGAPIAGATVAFAGGSVDPTSAVTGGDGLASTVLTPVVGSNTVTATVTGLAPVSFTATGNAVAVVEFITTWKTDNLSSGSSSSTQIRLPLVNGGTYNFLVDWGDSTSDTITAWNQVERTHTYPTAGTYTVTITGALNRWRFNFGGDRLKVLTVEQWGTDCVYDQYTQSWRGCNNVVFNATDVPTIVGTSLWMAWENCTSLTSFPLIDTSNVTTFTSAWQGCTGLTSFPAALNFAAGANFTSAWQGCTGLTSFPLVTFKTPETGTINLSWAWRDCTGLTSFPLIDTSNVALFSGAWSGCSGLLSFPELDTSAGTSFNSAWGYCTGLTSFPALNVAAGTTFQTAWQGCTGLTSFPALTFAVGFNFQYAWQFCSGLTSFPLADVSAGTSFVGAWQFCSGLTSFPALDFVVGNNFFGAWENCNNVDFTTFPLVTFKTTGTIGFQSAWRNCTALTSFPLVDTSAGTNFTSAWQDCTALTSFPLVDTSAGTLFNSAWRNCTALTSFPLVDTSAGTSFTSAWLGCAGLTSFPLVDVSAGTDFFGTWRDCTNLETLPALNVSAETDNTFKFEDAFLNTGAITAAPLSGTNADISFANNLLDAAALNAIYTGLADRTSLASRTITVSGNPGTSGDDPSIATAKNWVVSGS